MKKNSTLFWIIGFLCPVVGIILYFIFKNNDKSKSNSSIKGAVVGFCVIGIIILYISTHPFNYVNRSIDEWYEDITSGNTVVTVLGSSQCDHCQALKPVIINLAKKNDINLYFFEADSYNQSDYERLTKSFELQDFDGSVPYTFIMKNQEFLGQTTGYQNESVIKQFLWEYGIIKD